MPRQRMTGSDIPPDAQTSFEGAKLVLFCGDQIVVIRRDDLPGLAYANCLDLPGGQRDGDETPQACVLRELFEELGLALPEKDLKTPRYYLTPVRAWFFSAYLPPERAHDIRFGDEGQGWMLMPPEDFIASAEAVPHFRPRVAQILAAR